MTYNFDVEIATKIGVDEAIMLNNFVYWLLKNKANNKNFFDGNYWTFNSVRAYSELFPFWKESQIKRILKSLIDQNVLVVGNYNQNAYDRTNWYSLSSEYIYLIDWTISANGRAENSQPIPNNKPDIKTDNKPNNNIELPSCIQKTTWEEWVTFRKQAKKSLTDLTIKKQIKFLEDCFNKGQNPNLIIEQSIANGWIGLFELKQNNKQSYIDRCINENARTYEAPADPNKPF